MRRDHPVFILSHLVIAFFDPSDAPIWAPNRTPKGPPISPPSIAPAAISPPPCPWARSLDLSLISRLKRSLKMQLVAGLFTLCNFRFENPELDFAPKSNRKYALALINALMSSFEPRWKGEMDVNCDDRWVSTLLYENDATSTCNVSQAWRNEASRVRNASHSNRTVQYRYSE